ncbi:MAG: PDZ domain-containing protein [Actinomycetota bacterium]|nr:PDZ domain-containing protein [Actinomycetota bacterium]
MTQRGSTLTVAGVLLTILVSVAFLVPVPYVLESPGLTADTLGADVSVDGRATDQDVISFDRGVQTYPTEGELRLTTAQVTRADSKVTLFEAFGAWFDPADALIPRDVVYPPEQSAQEAQDQTRVAMTGSQETSEVAGVRAAGYDVEEYVLVAGVVVDGASDGTLEPGDRILAVDGGQVADSGDVVTAVRSREPGDTIEVTVLRAGQRRTVDITAGEIEDGDSARTSIGITVGPGFDLPVDVTFTLQRSIGGPSAGSMFALAIYDKLTPGSLTGGQVIAGTGEIDYDGKIGEIGGVAQKLVSSQADGAAVFLSPAGNCAEALQAPVDFDEIRVLRVETLGDAISSLEALAQDADASVPTC